MTEQLSARQVLLTLRLILGGMLGGVIVFTAIAVFVANDRASAPDPELGNLLLIALAATAAGLIVAAVVIRKVVIGSLRRTFEQEPPQENPTAGLILRWRNLTMIHGAMAEGAALFGTVVFFITGAWAALLATAAGLLVLVCLFPMSARLDGFAESITGQRSI